MLLSKFFLPELRPNRVNRPRLLERLGQAAGGQLVIVSAPAGFGKTTLVSEWVRSARFATGWISLDESDNDPTLFWAGLVTAIDRLYRGAGKNSQDILAAGPPAPPQVLLTTLLNDLILQGDNTADLRLACLVLDDTHLVNNALIYQGLLYLIEHLPHDLRLVLVGRTDPPIPLGRLRASGRVLELRAADLRFSLDESEVFLNRVMGFPLSQAQVKRLEERTEGWIAGLQLAGLAIQGLVDAQKPGEIDTFIEVFSGDDRFVLDYLAEEVLGRLPPELGTFLLQTAILDRMCGPLCEAVTGLPASQAMLERLERENLFLVPLDNHRQWYRYHHLFADLLRRQSERQGEDSLDRQRRKAAGWLAGQGFLAEAIGQALQGHDFEHAALWIEAYGESAIARGEYTSLKNWAEALPQAVLYSRPELLMQYVWALNYLREVTQYERPLLAAEQLWREKGNLARLGETLNLRADFAAGSGDGARAADLAQQALDLLPEDEEYHRGMSWMYVGAAAFLQGDMERAQQVLSAASTLCRRSGNATALRLIPVTLAQVEQAQGRLPEAARRLEEIISQLGSPYIYEGLVARMLLSTIWREWNRLDEAERGFRQVLEMADIAGQMGYFSQCYAHLALTLWEKGDLAGMQTVLDQQACLAERMQNAVGQQRGTAVTARLAVLSGDLEAASAWRESVPLPIEDPVPYVGETPYLTLARLLVRSGAREACEALELLAKLQSYAQAQQRVGSLIEIRMVRALALYRLNDAARACEALEESLARPGGYCCLYLDEGQPLVDLLRSLSRKPTLAPELRAYATQLLALAPDRQTPGPDDRATAANLKLIEPLTPREIEVLRMIQEGLSNREIAAKLYLTLNTVKVHAKNIYGKLGVASRTQAVHRAKEVGLI